MRIPRDVSGAQLASALRALGYERVRQTGSHIRPTTAIGGTHHVTVPNHDRIKLGTLAGILKAVAAHHGIGSEEVLRRLAL